MRKLLIAAGLLLAAASARAACIPTTIGSPTLYKLRNGDPSSVWIGCVNATIDALSASSVTLSGSTTTPSFLGAIYVNEIGGRSTGTANIKISSPVYTAAGAGAPYLTWRGTATIEGAGGLGVNYSLRVGSVTSTSFVSVGDYLTVAGTATISGAGGLGASSATLTGTSGPYDLTVATGVYLQAGELKFASGGAGIVFPDGSRQTSAAGAGSITGSGTIGKTPRFTSTSAIGDGSLVDSGSGVTLPATSSATLVNGTTMEIQATAFTQSITTITITNPPLIYGQWTEMISTRPATNATQISFAGLKSTETFTDVRYRLCGRWNSIGATAGTLQLTWNGSRSTAYGYLAYDFQNGSGAQTVHANPASATSCAIGNTNLFITGDEQSICIEFFPSIQGVELDYWGGGHNSANNFYTTQGHCTFKNDSSISSVEILVSAGSSMGNARFTLERMATK